MKIVQQSHEWITPLNRDVTLPRIEQIARTCYKSEGAIKPGSAEKMVAMLCKNHHYAMIEHISLSIKFITDRGVANEIVRHRIGSYAQESTRYCNYSKDKFDGELTFIKPCFWDEHSDQMRDWRSAMTLAENHYLGLLAMGATPQEARAVLPNSLKTELVMTANIREWRHFLNLRCDPAAHPQMREVALLLLDKLHDAVPVCFDDLWEKWYKMRIPGDPAFRDKEG